MDTNTTPPICPEGTSITPTQTNSNSKDIIGVSRSGRLRMKSSKLQGFQSPDDIETSTTQSNPSNSLTTILSEISPTTVSAISTSTIKKQGRGRPPKSSLLKKKKIFKTNENHLVATDRSNNSKSDNDLIIDDADLEKTLNELENDDDLGTSNSEDVGIDPTIKQSLYMTEKSNKKKILKDGKIVYSKAHRKDKGKSRYTAFMLWAKDTKTNFSNKNFDADFVDVYRLREMWSNVSKTEKLVWKRKAKKLKIGLSGKEVNTPKSTFLNRSSSNRTKKIFESNQKLPVAQITQKLNQEKRSSKSLKSSPKSPSPIKNRKMYVISPIDESKKSTGPLPSPIRSHPQDPINNNGIFKVTGQEPLDVAAHLNLLGENLSTIGKKLKEHEGQITVSGSLSVLLDSLLCSLGPLMCLTTNIPKLGTDRDKELKSNLEGTLNNIAYIMPGL